MQTHNTVEEIRNNLLTRRGTEYLLLPDPVINKYFFSYL